MRPSIAAALSNLGEVHSASDVLLRPEDAAKFAEAHLNGEVRMDRVIACPSGGLLLVLESGTCPPRTWTPGLHDRSQFALVGAVPKDAWTWADPKKRQPAPLARVNLDARDIHCLTQGGEIHRGATVGTTTGGRAALRQTYPVIDVAEVVRVAAGKVQAEALRRGTPAATAGRLFGLVLDVAPQIDAALAGPPAATRTPKDGDRLDSFTAAELDALPVGARFELSDYSVLERTADGWRKGSHATYPHTIVIGSQDLGHRTLVLPKPEVKPAKNGDRLVDLTAAQIDALPEGATFQGYSRTLTKHAGGWRDGIDGNYCNGKSLLHCASPLRLLMLPAEAPKPAPSPKVGDRWGALNDSQRAALPVGTVLDGTGSLPPVVKFGSGWVCVEDGGKVGGFVPERTIAFLPVSK